MTRATRLQHARTRRELGLAALVGLTLAGCPLTDHYYIDGTVGGGATGANGGAPPGPPKGKGGAENPDHEDCVAEPEVCDGVSNDCDADVDEDDVCPPGCSAEQREGHVYLLCVAPSSATYVTYQTARMRCGSAGNDLGLMVHFELTSVESADEEAFLKDWVASVAPATDSVWLGANDIMKGGTWVWGEGPQAAPFLHVGPMGAVPDPGKYADFAPGQPSGSNETDEDCAAFDGSLDWQWNDEYCSSPAAGYVCEQKP